MKPTLKIAAMILTLTNLISLSQAQTIDKKSLTIDGAKKVIAGAVAYAKKNNAPGGVIAVVDEGGNLVALERLDGTFAAGANISIGKARTAALFKKPTKAFEDIIRNGRTAMVALTGRNGAGCKADRTQRVARLGHRRRREPSHRQR